MKIAIVSAITLILVLILVIWFIGTRTKDTSMRQSAKATTSNSKGSGSPEPTPMTFPKLTVDQIFTGDHSWTATVAGNPRVRTLVATGDILPARTVNAKVIGYNDYLYPYKKTQNLTQNADITFGNLETPVFEGCKVTTEGMSFCGSHRNVEGLVYAGVDIVNLANNHTGNHAALGLQQTIRHLDAAGIAHTGTGSATIKDVRGKKFGFLGFSNIPGTCCGARSATTELIAEDVVKARPLVDILVVQFHWGTEYKEDPDALSRQLGKTAIDAGADLVIGNHPHWVQGLEWYKDKLITYSHGNFVFDQMWSIETRQGVVGKYTFYDDTLTDVEFTATVIEDASQPRPATIKESETIIGRMYRSSQRLTSVSR